MILLVGGQRFRRLRVSPPVRGPRHRPRVDHPRVLSAGGRPRGAHPHQRVGQFTQVSRRPGLATPTSTPVSPRSCGRCGISAPTCTCCCRASTSTTSLDDPARTPKTPSSIRFASRPTAFTNTSPRHAYRRHAPRWLIVRLAGMVGPGLKKNPVFDVLHGTAAVDSPGLPVPVHVHRRGRRRGVAADRIG